MRLAVGLSQLHIMIAVSVDANEGYARLTTSPFHTFSLESPYRTNSLNVLIALSEKEYSTFICLKTFTRYEIKLKSGWMITTIIAPMKGCKISHQFTILNKPG